MVAVLVVGRALVSLVLGLAGTAEQHRVGSPERWLLSALAFVGWATVLMVVHMLSGGWLFAQSWVVPLTSAFVVGVAMWRGRSPRVRPRVPGAVIALAVVLVGLYALPGIVGGSSLRTGDPPWHLGWTEQLLGGEVRPEGPAPEPFARNAYPWGHHAVMATMTRLVPGTHPMIAHEALQLLFLVWLPLAAACLARTVNPRAGPAAAAAFSLIGGFGWARARAADFIESPLDARYGADLVVASPNSVYELLPPALPRELGLVLLACAALLLLHLLARPERGKAVAAGLAVGLVGLVSVPMLISAIGWAVAAAVARRRLSRREAVLLASGATAVFALWAVPVALDHLRHGGFVDVSPRLGVEWPLLTGLAAWGLLGPLAIAGLVVVVMQPPLLRAGLVGFTVAAVGLLLTAWLRQRFGWEVLANRTALHQGRFWPPLHLVASALAGVGMVAGYGWLARRSTPLASLGVAIVVGVGAISPVLASVALTETIRDEKRGFLYGAADLQRGSFVRSAASVMDPDDVMSVEDDDLLAFYLWQFSGARIANEGTGAPEDNPWRIRYRELADAWRGTVQTDGIDADWVVTRSPGGREPVVEAGAFRGRRWALVRARD